MAQVMIMGKGYVEVDEQTMNRIIECHGDVSKFLETYANNTFSGKDKEEYRKMYLTYLQTLADKIKANESFGEHSVLDVVVSEAPEVLVEEVKRRGLDLSIPVNYENWIKTRPERNHRAGVCFLTLREALADEISMLLLRGGASSIKVKPSILNKNQVVPTRDGYSPLQQGGRANKEKTYDYKVLNMMLGMEGDILEHWKGDKDGFHLKIYNGIRKAFGDEEIAGSAKLEESQPNA